VEGSLGPGALHTAEIGPLSLSATRRLLSQRLGLTLPPRTLRRLFDATQGNPLLALELGRALADGRAWAIGAEPPVADLAGNPFGARVAQLPEPARRALLVMALSGRLSLAPLMTVADPAAVEDLVAAGLLVSDGERVRLAHPLLAVAARRHSRIAERQALHLALAKVAGDETSRARHLALSAPGQDAGLAGIVAAATTAAARLASGYDERAAALLADAAGSYGELGLRFDRARSLLWLGRAARRARKRTAARRALETASEEFEALGSPGWAGQARAELGLLGTRGAAPAGELTAAEQRVVDLAASGLSNKQIARRLFVAVHTVEVHLAHAYAKLGVRSRAQLASRLASPALPPAAE
jgi:DNA-binding CsgD family transcriptional regulator